MKLRTLFFVAFALLLAQAGRAQISYGTITGTIVDPNGAPYAYAQIRATFVNNQGFPIASGVTPNGQPFAANVVLGTADSTGHFSLALVRNDTITKPSGTQWAITVDSPADTNILTYEPAWRIRAVVSVTGNADISSTLNALAQPVHFMNLTTGQATITGNGLPANNPAFSGTLSGPSGNFTGSVTAAGFNGPLTGNVSGNVTGSVTGHASLDCALAGCTLTGGLAGTSAIFSSTLTAPLVDKAGQVFNVLAYGAKGDGTTDDTAAINSAISACNASASGRGTVLVPWGRYLIGSSNVQLMFTNGAAAGQPVHCSFNAHDATFVPSATFTDGFQLMGTPAKGGPLFHTITADIASGATTLTLDSVSGYSVGQLGYYAYGQVPTNIHETLNNGFATITAINAGTNTITLDTQLSAPMAVASTPAENRWFFVPNTLDGISIDFGFIDNSANGCSTAPCTGKNNFEAAFYPSFVRGGSIQGRCYEGYNCWYIQFGSGIDFPSLISDSATQTAGGDTSYGRCGDFSEVSDSTIHVLKCKNFVNGALALEAAERNVMFDSVELSDNAASPGPNNCYFCSGDSSIFRVGTFKAEGLGSVGGTSQGTLVAGNGPVQADFGTVIDGTVNGIGVGVGGSTTLANIGTFQVLKVPAGVTGTSPVSGTFSSALPYSGWTCTVNLSNTATQFCNLPSGVPRSFQITSQVGGADYTSIVPGYGSFGQGSSFSSSLVAGVPLDLTSTLGSWGQNDLHSANSPFNYLAFTPAVGKSGTDTLTITGSYWPFSFTGYTTPYPMAAINGGAVPISAPCLGTDSSGKPISISCLTAATQTIASGTVALPTTAVAAGTCDASPTPVTATGVLTTDVIGADFNRDPTAITGYGSGGLAVYKYPTANTVNFKRCNNTSGSITPSAATLNWQVVR